MERAYGPPARLGPAGDIAMSFAVGRTVLRRYWQAGRISFYNVVTVVSDDERGLRLWQPADAPYRRLMTPDGRTHHDGTVDALGPMALAERTWTGSAIMPLPPLGRRWRGVRRLCRSHA